MRKAALACAASLCLAACGHRGTPGGEATAAPSAAASAASDRLAPLHAFEAERRKAADWAHLPPSDRALGPDPISIRALPGPHGEVGRGSSYPSGPTHFVGLLRGRDALVLLDASLKEIARTTTPPLPTGLAVTAGTAVTTGSPVEAPSVCVTGEQSPRILCYTIKDDAFTSPRDVHLDPHPLGLRDVALGGTAADPVVYAVDEREGQLYVSRAGKTTVVHAGTGAFRVARAGDRLIVDCLLDHSLVIFDLDPQGLPIEGHRRTIRHDGPMWGFDAVPTPEGLLFAAGGVEDHVLDRTEGSFGFIDSFVFLYRIPPEGDPVRLAAVNVSEQGVITPKAVSLQVQGQAVTVLAAGYGSDRLAYLTWSGDLKAPPRVVTMPILPGAASMATSSADVTAFADPLLDAWFLLTHRPTPVPVQDSAPTPRSSASHVGEALFFTNLMAPWNKSEGRLSRFTCETCHFEGYVDGRTHHTGRGDIKATTKPLLGIFNNRPHFSRALDPNLTIMVDNEFRAAGAKSDHDPWFSVVESPIRWTPLLGPKEADLTAVELRRSLMAFFMDFTHRPNPAALGRSSFDEKERKGAEVFQKRGCEGCHQARLSADDPSTRMTPDRWEPLVMSREGSLVWGSDGYHKTGIEPYVHDQGARTPSLRRLYKKRPYFTNGSAKTLRDVLERVRFKGTETWHDEAPPGATGLSADEVAALSAFLDLL